MPYTSLNTIRIYGVITSLIFSCIAVGFHNIIGRDSIHYIATAQGYLEGGFSEALQLFGWPFYSILFGFVHKFTGIPLEISARIVDAVLIAMIVDGFFRLYQETFPEAKSNWIALVTVLAFIGLNDYRYELLRDWGFLAFTLRSLLYLLRMFKSPSLSNSIYWQLCICIAFLFRIEAIVFMVFAPIILLFRKDSLTTRLMNFVNANVLFILAILVLIGTFTYSNITEDNLGRIKEIIAYIDFSKSIDIISKTTYQIENHVIPYHGSDQATIFLLSGIFGILLFKVLTKIGIIFNTIWIFGYFSNHSSSGNKYSGIIFYYTVIAFFTVYVFVAHSMVLAGRYVLLTSLLSLIFVSYCFENLVIHCMDNKKTGTLTFLKLLVIVNISIGLFHGSNSKEYLKLLGEWTTSNIPKSARLISNDPRLYYYSGRKIPYNRFEGGFLKPKWITPELLADTHYVTLRLKSGNDEFNKFTNANRAQKIKQFCNSKGDCAALFKIKERTKRFKNPIGSL